MMRDDVAFQGGSRSICDDRSLVRSADAHDFGDFIRRIREHDGIGPVRVVPRLVLAVVVAHAGAGGKALAESGA